MANRKQKTKPKNGAGREVKGHAPERHVVSEVAEVPNAKSRSLRLPANLVVDSIRLPQRVVGQIADEVVKRLSRQEAAALAAPEVIVNGVFLDTSAIIDGRVFDLIELGVFSGPFVLVSGVLSELKNIADSKDPVKRARGRIAMAALVKFKRTQKKSVQTIDTESVRAVDDEIIYQTKIAHGRIVTGDFNLTRKARIEGVVAVDLYEVANVLKTPAIPGDTFHIEIIQPGKGAGQGVGYLSDGTMIVVEDGADLIGESARVTVTRVIQTEAGKIFFGRAL